MFLYGAGSSPWGSTERLHALRGLLSIAAAEPTLLEALQPAVQGWLAVGAAGSAQGDTLAAPPHLRCAYMHPAPLFLPCTAHSGV